MPDKSIHAPLKMYDHYMRGFRNGMFPYDSLRLVYIVETGAEGSFDWIINDTHHQIHAGDFVLFTPFDLRMPILRLRGQNVRIRTLTFQPDFTGSDISLLDLYGAIARMPVIPAETAKPLMPIYTRICEECSKKDPLSEEAAAAAIRLFLIDFLRLTMDGQDPEQMPRSRTSLAHARLVNDVVSYLRMNLTEKLSIGEVAAHFHISESSLSKLFRSMVGMTFPEYIRRLRVNRVIDIVCDGDTGVLDAAMEAGFGSISGFYKSFAAITGTTPSDFISVAKSAGRLSKNAEK